MQRQYIKIYDFEANDLEEFDDFADNAYQIYEDEVRYFYLVSVEWLKRNYQDYLDLVNE